MFFINAKSMILIPELVKWIIIVHTPHKSYVIIYNYIRNMI